MKDYASMLLGGDAAPEQRDYAGQLLEMRTPIADLLSRPPPPTPIERIGRGVADYTEGAEQIGRQIVGNNADAFTRQRMDDLELYERGRGPDAGIDWWRIVGNAATTAPLMALPGVSSANWAARGGAGAVGGGIGSGAMFTPEGESRALNTVLGATIGGGTAIAVPMIAERVRKGVRWAWEKLAGRNVSDEATGAVLQAAQQAGVEPAQLQQNGIMASLAAEVDDAMRAGTQFTPAQLQRLVEMRAVGANPMKANITRTPEDWGLMENLRGMPKTGAPLNNRIVENAKALVDYTEGLKAGTGGRAASPYEAGASVLDAVQAKSREMQAEVGNLYEQIRAQSGANPGLVPKKMLAVLDEISDDKAADPLVDSVTRRLKRIGLFDKQGNPTGQSVTVRVAEELRKWIGGLSDSKDPAVRRLKGLVIDALDDDVIDTAGTDAFRAARDAARARFAEFEKGVLGPASRGDLSPDDFVRKHVAGAKVDDLKAMKQTLTSGTPEQAERGTQAWNDARGWVVTDLLMKATGASSPEDVVGRTFSGAKFAKAMDALGLEKTAILFTPSEMASLRTLRNASQYLTTAVPGSAANYSRSGSMLAEKIGQMFPKIPLVASILGGPMAGAGAAAATAAAKAAGNRAGARALTQQLGGLPTAAPMQIRPNPALGVLPPVLAAQPNKPRSGKQN